MNNFINILIHNLIRFFILKYLLFFGGSVFCQNSSVSNIPGITLWLRADTGITYNSNKINSWKSVDTRGLNAYQLNFNDMPDTQLVSSLNNNITVNFNNSTLLIDSSLSIQTVYAVFNWDGNQSTFPDYNGLISQQIFTSNNTNIIAASGGSTNLYSTTPDNLFINDSVNINNLYTTNFSPLNSFKLFKASSGIIKTFDNLIIGRFFNFSPRTWHGKLAEIITFNRSLNSSEKALIEAYLNNKYAPDIKLPIDINITNSFCDTIIEPTTLKYNHYNNFQWSTGAVTPTISVTKSGKYWVNATNIFGRVSSDTIIVSFPNYNKPIINSICVNSLTQWNTQLPKSNFSFQWQDNSTDSIFNVNQAGDYYVKITDSFGCSITSDTTHIAIDNFSNTVSLGPDLSLCAGNSISLVSGTVPSLTYTWSTSSNNDSITVTNSGQYSVIVTNTNSCVAKDTINITITGLAPVANFTSSVGCKNNAVSFTDLSIPPSGNSINTYLWNFGDPLSASNTSTLSNPFHTYTDTGYYSVKLKIITNVGCEQSISKMIHIAPKPLINFTIGLSCQNDSTAFTSSITNPINYTTSSLQWNFGDPSSGVANTSTIPAPKHLFSNANNYTITLVATNNVGCKDSLRNIIAVKAQVKADFTYSSACTNTATVFQDNSIVPAPNSTNIRSWNFGTSTANGLIVSKNYTNPGVYSVTLSVTGNNGCNSSISKIITVFNPPIAGFVAAPFCAKDTITVLNTSTPQSGIISSNIWKLNNAYFSSVSNPSLSISTAGSFPLKLTVTNSFGCKDSISKNITVNPIPNIDFTTNPSSYYYVNSTINFIPNITNANSYLWDIASTTTTTLQSPNTTFSNTGTYSVSLSVKDQQGCKNSIIKNLLVTKRVLDLAILNVISSKDNDGFISVETDIANYGTIPASTIDLNYQVSDGGNIKETWTGNLIPNAVFTYTFSSKTATQINSTNNITCVDIKKVNSINDENSNNNTLCSSLNSDAISVSNPIPNPTNADINLPIILNKDMDITISIYNSTGQLISKEITQKGIAGLNFITLPSSNYARGCYIIKTMIDDKIFIKKFIKISNE